MRLIPNNSRLKSWIFCLSAATLLLDSFASIHDESDHLSTVKNWLHDRESQLTPIFEYEPNDPYREKLDSTDLHKAIDKVFGTVVIVRVRVPYSEKSVTIGGYNPYSWKSWSGRYEVNPGRFVFNLDEGQKWEKYTRFQGQEKRDPERYGLSFGRGDLVIDPSLETGSARNSDFAPNSDTSQLLGDSGVFEIERLAVYRVEKRVNMPGYAFAPIKTPSSSGPSNPVPDSTSPLLFTFALIGILFANLLYRSRQ